MSINRIFYLTGIFLQFTFFVKGQDTGNSAFRLPLRHLMVTSPYGWRIHPLTGKRQFHSGVDLAAASDTVFCIAGGCVAEVRSDPVNGNYIAVDHGDGLQSFYCHLSAIAVLPGEPLIAGQVLGLTGATGRTTGEHLHLTIKYQGRPISPLQFLGGLAEKPP